MKIIFAGTPAFAATHLEALIRSSHEVIAVITQPDKPGKRGKKLQPSAVKVVAEANNLPVLQPARLGTEQLTPLEADLMVVVAYGQILKPEVLAYPRLGCVNVHASLLPRWRGAAPVQRAILAGDTGSGITLIQMDEGLDTGDMLATAPVEIREDETAGSLFEAFSEVGPALLTGLLDDLETGAVHPVKQDDTLSTYAHKLDKEEACIDWQQPAVNIDRKVRAFNPEPIAYSFLGKHRVRIHEGSVNAGRSGEPGTILEVTKAGVLVGCDEGSLLIRKLQLPVGKGSILDGQQILNGFSEIVSPGTRFTPSPIQSATSS